MSHPPLYDERPAQRRRGRISERAITVMAVVVAIVAVLVAAVLGVLLAQKSDSSTTGLAETTAAGSSSATPTSTSNRRPAQPKTRAGARTAAQRAFDLYTSGQYGPFWDRWTSSAQQLISRRDYIRRFKLCPAAAEGLRFEISSASVMGNRAKVTAARSIATFTFDFVYERGAWRFVPDAEQQREYKTKSVEQIVREERTAGTCG